MKMITNGKPASRNCLTQGVKTSCDWPGCTSTDTPNPDITGAHNALHRTLLDVRDTDVAAAHDRQACRRGTAADVDVAAALDGCRERRHGATLDLDVTRTLNLRHHGAVDLLDADVAGTLNGELRTGDATGEHVVALHTCSERAVRVADDDIAEDAVRVDGSTLRHLDGDLDCVLTTTAAGNHGRHVAASEDVAHDGAIADDDTAVGKTTAGDDCAPVSGLDDGAPASADDGDVATGRVGAVTFDDEPIALNAGSNGLDLVGGAGDGVLDVDVAMRFDLDRGGDIANLEGRGGNPFRAFGDRLAVAAGIRATDIDVAGADVAHLAGADVTRTAIGEGDARIDDGRHLLVGIDRLAVDGGDERHNVLLKGSGWVGLRYVPSVGTSYYDTTFVDTSQYTTSVKHSSTTRRLYITLAQSL